MRRRGSALPYQGWLTEDHRYFLHGDEGDEIQGLTDRTRTISWDVADLDDPVIGGEYLGAWSVYPYFESGLIAVSSGAEGVFFLRHTPADPPTF